MCGRFTLTAESRHIEKRFGAKLITGTFETNLIADPGGRQR